MKPNGWRSEKVRRPRGLVEPYVRLLAEELEALNPGLEWYVGGSWRRGAPVIGDLDVLIITPTGSMQPDLLDPGVELPSCVTWQRSGPRIANGDMQLPDGPLHIDFWSAKPASRGAMLCFFTGPMQLNVYQRQRAKRNGMAFSQNALADRTTGRQLDDGTEQDCYRLLGMEYLTPEQRQRWAQ